MMGDGAGTPIIIERRTACPVCKRFLGKAMMPETLAVGVVKTHTYCASCRKWRWCDVAIGQIRLE